MKLFFHASKGTSTQLWGPRAKRLWLPIALGCSAMALDASAASVSLPAAADAVISVHPNMGYGYLPQGTATYLSVIGLTGYQTSTLLKFDLTEWAGRAAEGDGIVTMSGASLAYTNGVMVQTSLVTQAWQEATVTWNNFNAGATSPLNPFTLFATPGTVFSFDVVIPKAIIQQWLDQPAQNHGILLSAASSVQRDLSFASREHQPEWGSVGVWAPRLTLSIAGAVPEPAAAAMCLAGLACFTGLGRKMRG